MNIVPYDPKPGVAARAWSGEEPSGHAVAARMRVKLIARKTPLARLAQMLGGRSKRS